MAAAPPSARARLAQRLKPAGRAAGQGLLVGVHVHQFDAQPEVVLAVILGPFAAAPYQQRLRERPHQVSLAHDGPARGFVCGQQQLTAGQVKQGKRNVVNLDFGAKELAQAMGVQPEAAWLLFLRVNLHVLGDFKALGPLVAPITARDGTMTRSAHRAVCAMPR